MSRRPSNALGEMRLVKRVVDRVTASARAQREGRRFVEVAPGTWAAPTVPAHANPDPLNSPIARRLLGSADLEELEELRELLGL